MHSRAGDLVLLVILLLLLCAQLEHAVAETAKHSSKYCYDNCSNHGLCVDNVCICESGWYGENCATRFGLPPLSVGSRNLTSLGDLNQVAFKHEAVLIGLSSHSCAKCGWAEDEYARANFSSVVFVRVDAAEHPEMLPALGLDPSLPLPLLVFSFDKGRSRSLYRGMHSAEMLSRFCESKGAPPGWTRWHETKTYPANLNSSVAIGFFSGSGKGKVDEDTEEWEEFIATASKLRARHDIAVYLLVLDAKAKRPDWAPGRNVQLPAWGVLAAHAPPVAWRYTTMTERPPSMGANERPSYAEWIAITSVIEAAPLSVESFAAMEDLGLPMLMLFAKSESDMMPLLTAFKETAREFRGRMTFLYDAKGDFAHRKHVLGLNGAEDVRVEMAINTRDVGPVPFRGLITPESFKAFCSAYLSGRAQPLSSEGAQAAGISAAKGDNDGPDQPGVKESFTPEDEGIVDATDRWAGVALDESTDVLVFVYRSKGCLACKQLTPYYKKVARRFADLKRTSTKHHVICARLDLDRYRPHDLAADTSVPAILMLPAFHKDPPFRAFSAVAKVFTIMEWARLNAGRPFEWGEELPQFTKEEKVLFKEQIRAREQAKTASVKTPRDDL